MSRLLTILFTAALLSACGGSPTETTSEVEPTGAVQSASCSGDQCGCYDEFCGQQCPPLTNPEGQACFREVRACMRAQVQCAIACCAP
jgi:hypothetical protein